MATQYELEHNVKFSESRRAGRRVDMASFFSLLNQLDEPTTTQNPHNNPHATPTPVDTAALFRLLQSQMQTLLTTAPTTDNRSFLEDLINSLEEDIHDPPTRLQGASQEFVDMLDRVNRKKLDKEDDCAICKVPYLEDEYCLVVELPCKGKHRFDLEKKEVPIVEDDEEEDGDMMYA
ncbi:hypothetical protein T069G_02596 [Trichoderma breve]|uniref:Uncharacterized protein n=1 Tax=Trichoderma breve TaxID=2034170 RepID=A0A9W9BE55_9HYPO|nr:hypothetical protein T069G_02596 [Trichoderma breve]KAJ4861642.1 hypothetical protein T069G_02596 [Trichoderma breve]